jgi:cell division ATPase MinD
LPTDETRTISVVSGKGGVGKTTLVINLGSVLAHTYKKNVVIIDANITTSHVGLYLGMYYCPVTLNQVLKGDAKIENAMYDHFSGVKLIPSSLSVKDLEGVDIAKLENSINKLFGKTDIILIDSAPGLGREAVAAMKASEEVIFVTTPYIPSVMDVIRCKQVTDKLGLKSLGVVLNMVKNERYELTPREVEQLTELQVLASIPMDKNILKSLATRSPVIFYNPKSKASKEFNKLGAKILGEEIITVSPWQKLLRFLGLK